MEGLGIPSRWLTLVEEFRVEITWWCNRDRLEDLTDIPPVIAAVGENMKKDFFSGHATPVAIGKDEGDAL